MDYEYDFFLSYPSRAAAGRWVREHFHPVLQEELESLDAHATLFCWTDGEIGSVWPELIKDAHARSRLLIAVLTPPYFYKSPWCRAEWATMIARHKHVGLLALLGNQSLICPVLYSDGDSHPDEARAISDFDFRAWANPDPPFRHMTAFVRFRRHVRKFADAILKRRDLAPPWSANWPVLQPEVLLPQRAPLQRF